MTDKELEPLDGGIELVVKVEQEVLDRMNDWLVSLCLNERARSRGWRSADQNVWDHGGQVYRAAWQSAFLSFPEIICSTNQEDNHQTGLTKLCLESKTTITEIDSLVSSYVAQHFPPGFTSCLLAGNSVHVDKMFINKVRFPGAQWEI